MQKNRTPIACLSLVGSLISSHIGMDWLLGEERRFIGIRLLNAKKKLNDIATINTTNVSETNDQRSSCEIALLWLYSMCFRLS